MHKEYIITFLLEDGSQVDLWTDEAKFSQCYKNDEGTLVYQGTSIIDFIVE